MKWQRINPHCLRSGQWLIAKHGGPRPKYLLTYDAKPNALMWFSSAQEAMDTAERLAAG